MSDTKTRLIETIFDDDGTPYAETRFSPISNTTRARCIAPPATTIPVVFVPGVMGSNLKAKKKIDLPGGGDSIDQGERIWDVETKTSPAGWAFKGAAYRQAVMNHGAVMVDNDGRIAQDYTRYVEKVGGAYRTKIEPTGKTLQAGLNVEEAKRRGWGSPGWGFYGDFLDWLEYHLNKGRLVDDKPDDVFQRIAQLAGQAPDDVKSCAIPLTPEQIRKTLDIHMPVYAVGYNWLQSNMDSGQELMEGVAGIDPDGSDRVLGINDIIERENDKPGQVCDQVIVVTHSMGGLVGRAAALKYDDDNKILGIIHGVQPIDGAAKFYKEIAAGAAGDSPGLFGPIQDHVLSNSAKEAIPTLAYNPGPLELAPNQRYNGGKPWLFVRDQKGNQLELPQNGDPYEEIYMDTENVWRAVNPAWLDPSGELANPVYLYKNTVQTAQSYHDPAKGGIAGKLHPQTYAHWGDDPDYKSFGTITWETGRPLPTSQTTPRDWSFYDKHPLPKDGRHRLVDRGDGGVNILSIGRPAAPGDGTVPADASAAQIAGYGCQMACALTGFDHQGDFDNDQVRNVVLDAIVRLVEPVEVTS